MNEFSSPPLLQMLHQSRPGTLGEVSSRFIAVSRTFDDQPHYFCSQPFPNHFRLLTFNFNLFSLTSPSVDIRFCISSVKVMSFEAFQTGRPLLPGFFHDSNTPQSLSLNGPCSLCFPDLNLILSGQDDYFSLECSLASPGLLSFCAGFLFEHLPDSLMEKIS